MGTPPPSLPRLDLPMPPHTAKDAVADHADDQDAVEHADQPDVQPHVAVEDVAELVGDHALQLVAGEVLQRAPGDADHGVVRC